MRDGIPLLAVATSFAVLSGIDAPQRLVEARRHADAVTNSVAEFYISGQSFGPDNGEQENATCAGTHTWRTDSVNWAKSGPPIWVKVVTFNRTGCSNAGMDFYLGGEVGIYAEGAGYSSPGMVLAADAVSNGSLTNVPTIEGVNVIITAGPWYWENFRFVYWDITREDYSTYRAYSRDLVRPINTTDLEYRARFKVCEWNSWAGRCDNDVHCTNPWGPVSCDSLGGGGGGGEAGGAWRGGEEGSVIIGAPRTKASRPTHVRTLMAPTRSTASAAPARRY